MTFISVHFFFSVYEIWLTKWQRKKMSDIHLYLLHEVCTIFAWRRKKVTQKWPKWNAVITVHFNRFYMWVISKHSVIKEHFSETKNEIPTGKSLNVNTTKRKMKGNEITNSREIILWWFVCTKCCCCCPCVTLFSKSFPWSNFCHNNFKVSVKFKMSQQWRWNIDNDNNKKVKKKLQLSEREEKNMNWNFKFKLNYAYIFEINPWKRCVRHIGKW